MLRATLELSSHPLVPISSRARPPRALCLTPGITRTPHCVLYCPAVPLSCIPSVGLTEMGSTGTW